MAVNILLPNILVTSQIFNYFWLFYLLLLVCSFLKKGRNLFMENFSSYSLSLFQRNKMLDKIFYARDM